MVPVMKVKRRTSGKDVSRNRASFLISNVMWNFQDIM